MSQRMLLILSHKLTTEQYTDAKKRYGVEKFITLPYELDTLWKSIPPNKKSITDLLNAIRFWMDEQSRKGDTILVQGDFGATYLIVNYSFKIGLVPVYATTHREVSQVENIDGSIIQKTRFKHVQFREYERGVD